MAAAANFKHDSLSQLYSALSEIISYQPLEYLPMLCAKTYQSLHLSLDWLIMHKLDILAGRREKEGETGEEETKGNLKGRAGLEAELKEFSQRAYLWEERLQ